MTREEILNLPYDEKIKLIKQKEFLTIFMKDENKWIRREVAKQGFGLNLLKNDASPWVRQEVARQGYGLDILANDEDKWVRETAQEKLEELETVEEKEDNLKLPKHYKWDLNVTTKEVVDEIIKDLKGSRAFNLGNAIKYLIRAEKKNGLEDYKKARVYLDWIIEEIENCDKKKTS